MNHQWTKAAAELALVCFGSQIIACGVPAEDAKDNAERADVAQSARALQAERADGQELFKEIFFPNEQSSKRAPALARLFEHSGLTSATSAQKSAIAEVQEILVSDLADLDASFFERFAARVSSGKVLEVDDALNESSFLLQASLRRLSKQLEDVLSDKSLAQLDKKLAADPRLKSWGQLATLDRAALQQLAALLRDSVVRIPDDDAILRYTDVAVQRSLFVPTAVDVERIRPPIIDAYLDVDLQRQVARPPIIGTNIDLNLQRQVVRPPNIDFNIQRQIVRPPYLDVQLNRQIARPPIAYVDVARISSLYNAVAIESELAQVGSVTVDVETAIYAVAVVAVAVVAVAVLVFGTPIGEGAEYLNGKSVQLFRDQLVADITLGYAR